MLGQIPLFFILGISMEIALVVQKTNLGIDNNVAPFGQMNNHIGVATFTYLIL